LKWASNALPSFPYPLNIPANRQISLWSDSNVNRSGSRASKKIALDATALQIRPFRLQSIALEEKLD
jgi:hypothetical protein